MKLLADVNLDADIVGGLRADGHDVEWLNEVLPERREPPE